MPADTIRPFDGHLFRVLKKAADAAASKHFDLIRTYLKSGAEVDVPIFIESNKFRFGAELYALKNQYAANKNNC